MSEMLEVGSIFDDRYMLFRRIGRGASGEVWHARDQQISREVALKIMHQELMFSDIHLTRFQREINSLNELGNSHPNIPQLFGANMVVKRPYLVMEHIAGNSLSDMLLSHSIFKLPVETRIQKVVRNLADALTFAHDRGIVHRDIKPDNVKIIGNADKTYLLDFSIAVLDLDATRASMGTPRYIAPEIRSSPAADLFSFAILVYEMLFGSHPVFTLNDALGTTINAQQIMISRLENNEWKRPSGLSFDSASMPTHIDWFAVDAVFEAAFALEPKKRPSSADAFCEALQQAFREEATADIVISMLSMSRNVVAMQDELGASLDPDSATTIEPAEDGPSRLKLSHVEPVSSYVTQIALSRIQLMSLAVGLLIIGLLTGVLIGLSL